MATKFTPRIKRARIGTPGFSADTMARLGTVLNEAIIARLDRALDIYDVPAPALTPKYLKFKTKGKYHGTSLRDLKLTGQTRRSMRLLRASQNRAEIGFSDPVGAFRVKTNARLSRQYGVSPTDLEALKKAIHEVVDKPFSVKTF